MSYKFFCHECELKMELADDLIGFKFCCPRCKQKYRLEPNPDAEDNSADTRTRPVKDIPEDKGLQKNKKAN